MAGMVVWAACALFAASVVSDLRRRRVPNPIPVALVALFAVYAVLGGTGQSGPLWGHLAIAAGLLAAGFALYLTGGFGAGDGKLIAVAGLWVGPSDLSVFLIGLSVGAFALCLYALLPFEAARRVRSELPFAVAIAPPALAVMIPRALAHGIQL